MPDVRHAGHDGCQRHRVRARTRRAQVSGQRFFDLMGKSAVLCVRRCPGPLHHQLLGLDAEVSCRTPWRFLLTALPTAWLRITCAALFIVRLVAGSGALGWCGRERGAH
jgi:hypothetical protein